MKDQSGQKTDSNRNQIGQAYADKRQFFAQIFHLNRKSKNGSHGGGTGENRHRTDSRSAVVKRGGNREGDDARNLQKGAEYRDKKETFQSRLVAQVVGDIFWTKKSGEETDQADDDKNQRQHAKNGLPAGGKRPEPFFLIFDEDIKPNSDNDSVDQNSKQKIVHIFGD